MLLDAFAAERLRFFRARGTVFWSILFVPIAALVLGIGSHLLFHNIAAKVGGLPPELKSQAMDLTRQAAQAMIGADFFFIHLFFMVAAAAVFAGDYRWETWRLLTPRNSRANLMLAKFATYAMAAAITLVLMGVGGIVSGLFGALLNGHPIVLWGPDSDPSKMIMASFVITWLQLVILGGIAACVAVVTRSGIAAIFIPVAASFVQMIVMNQIRFEDPTKPPIESIIGLPGVAAEVLRALLLSGPLDPKPEGGAIALLSLLVWCGALIALAVFLFRRQDLTRE